MSKFYLDKIFRQSINDLMVTHDKRLFSRPIDWSRQTKHYIQNIWKVIFFWTATFVTFVQQALVNISQTFFIITNCLKLLLLRIAFGVFHESFINEWLNKNSV